MVILILKDAISTREAKCWTCNFLYHSIDQSSKEKGKSMHAFKKLKSLYLLLFTLNFLLITCLSQQTSSRFCGKIPIRSSNSTACLSQQTSSRFCGKIPIRSPFLSSNSIVPSLLNHMMLCKSQKLYFRTILGLFQVSSINYTTKTLTISHPSCSSSQHFVSPVALSAGFPTPPTPNSLLLFNCSSKTNPMVLFLGSFKACAASCKHQDQELNNHITYYSCLLVDDLENIDKGFHPKDMNCSHYSLVHRSSSNGDGYNEYELGTRISFDIPDHVPDICNECEKPTGNCGVGLRCICHPKECRDKVISVAGSFKPFSNNNVLLTILSCIIVLVSSFKF